MSAKGTTGSGISGVISGLENWGAGAVAGFEKLAVGIVAKWTGSQFQTLTDAGNAFKTTVQGGGSSTDAWNAAYAVLAKEEAASFTEAELGLVDAVIEILGTAPSL